MASSDSFPFPYILVRMNLAINPCDVHGRHRSWIALRVKVRMPGYEILA